jgi:hypothetical protein
MITAIAAPYIEGPARAGIVLRLSLDWHAMASDHDNPNLKPRTEQQRLTVNSNPEFHREWPLDPGREVTVVRIRGDEIGPSPITRKTADRWAKDRLRGTFTNEDTGWAISVGSSGIEEGLHRLTGAKPPEAIAAIPGLIKSATVAESRADLLHRPEIKAFHTFIAPLMIGETLYFGRMTTKETNHGNHYHGHQIQSLELGKEIPGVISGDRKPTGQLGHPRPPGIVRLGLLLTHFKPARVVP